MNSVSKTQNMQSVQCAFEPLLSDIQAGQLLALHPKTVQRLARSGELPAIHIGRYWRFRVTALDQWVAVHSTGQSVCVN